MKKNNEKIDTVKTVNRNVRSSPRKVNIILKNIRGKKVDVAIRDLTFARKRISKEIYACSLKAPEGQWKGKISERTNRGLIQHVSKNRNPILFHFFPIIYQASFLFFPV